MIFYVIYYVFVYMYNVQKCYIMKNTLQYFTSVYMLYCILQLYK